MPPNRLPVLDTREQVDLPHAINSLRVVEHADSYVASLGIGRHPQPTFQGDLPAALTTLSDNQLGDLLNDAGKWCSYVQEQLAIASARREEARKVMDLTEASIRVSLGALSDKKMTVQDKNDAVTVHPKTVEASANLLYWETVHQYLRVISDAAQRNWDTVSRRITQRGQDLGRGGREGNIAGAPTGLPVRTFVRRGG